MLTSEYFLKALQADAYKFKLWAIEVFSICDFTVLEEVETDTLYPYQVVTKKQAMDKAFAVIPENGELTLVPLEQYKKGEPLCKLRGAFSLKKGDLPNVAEDIVTTYGNAFINCYIIIYPFGDKYPFQTGNVNVGKIETWIADTLTSTPKEGDTRNKSVAYVDEYLKYSEACLSLEGFSMLCVQAASPSTMVPNPLVVKRRDELFEEFKDQLDDPAIIARIQMELAKVDKESLKDDVSKDFYMKDKSFDVIRMKRYAMYGLDGGFGDMSDAKLNKNSLDEGWDIRELPQMADTARSGSYARGKETALGGESVKTFYRIFQNISISDDDCKTKLGFEYLITEKDAKRYIGLNAIKPDGSTYMITAENVSPLINTNVKIRTPMLCKIKAPNFCKVCAGASLSEKPDAVHIVTSDVGSAFMGARMGAMHGKALRTVKYDTMRAIT